MIERPADTEKPDGFNLRTPVASATVTGRWGAVLLLVTVALVAVVAALGLSLWVFYQALTRIHEEHVALVAWQQQQAEAMEAAGCITALPPEGDDRIKALKSGTPCYYAKFVYEPKPSQPHIIVVPSTPAPVVIAPPARPRAATPPSPPTAEPAHPAWPSSGAPSHP